MTHEKIINMLAQRIVNSEKITTMQGAVEYVLQWADEHQKNPWRDMKKDPPERELGNKICYTFLDTESDGVHEQRFYHYAEFKKCCFSRKEWLDEDGNLVLVGIADFWMPIPETPKGGEK